MHKRAFKGMKRTFMHVSGLPPPYFEKSFQMRIDYFKSKYGKVRAGFFPTISFKNSICKLIDGFLETWSTTRVLQKTAFQGLERTFMHTQVFPHHYLLSEIVIN